LNGCVSCYFQVDVPVRNDFYPETPFDPATDPLLAMDVAAFLDAMEELVVGPMRETRALFEEHAQVTRLYTTMSADEMKVDPEFDLNPELPDISNVHTAVQELSCDGNGEWTITLPQGTQLTGTGTTWPVTLEDDEMPFNLRILQLSTSGDGEVVLDNTDLVVARLVDLGLAAPGSEGPGGVPVGPGTPGEPEPAGPNGSSGEEMPARTSSDGCNVAHSGSKRVSGLVWLLFSALALVVVRREQVAWPRTR
jgi:hypothetical protein